MMIKNKNKPVHLLYSFRTILFLVASVLLIAHAGAAVPGTGQSKVATASITAEQWELAREGEKIAAIKGLNAVIRQWSSSSEKLIEIYYPGGEEGEIWVNELMAWLVSLGVSSRFIMAVPGSGQGDVMKFKLINDGDSFSE